MENPFQTVGPQAGRKLGPSPAGLRGGIEEQAGECFLRLPLCPGGFGVIKAFKQGGGRLCGRQTFPKTRTHVVIPWGRGPGAVTPCQVLSEERPGAPSLLPLLIVSSSSHPSFPSLLGTLSVTGWWPAIGGILSLLGNPPPGLQMPVSGGGGAG